MHSFPVDCFPYYHNTINWELKFMLYTDYIPPKENVSFNKRIDVIP